MPRWLIRLEGDNVDLAEFPRHFPDGDAFVVQEGNEYLFTGPAFDHLGDAAVVRDEASRRVAEYSALISLFWPKLRKPTVGNVYRDEQDGRRNIFMFPAAAAVDMRGHGTATFVSGNSTVSPGPTEAQLMFEKARTSVPLNTAINLWALAYMPDAVRKPGDRRLKRADYIRVPL